MLYAVFFEDNPAADPNLRKNHMPAHLAFLARHAVTVRAAGPLLACADEPPGGLWLVEAEDADEVTALIKDDPFWPTGLRASWRIFQWQRVFADGKALI